MNPAIQMKGGWLNPCVAGICGLSVVPRLLAAFLFLACFASYHASAATCVSLPTNIIGWWSGDGNANDLVSTNNGTLQGGATATAPGMVASAFTFDGTNAFVQIPNSAGLRPTNLTIEAWVRFSGLDSAGSGGSPAGDQYIVFRQNTRSTDFEGFDLSKTRVGGSDVFRFLIASSSGQTAQINSSTTITTGLWYHVAAVRGSNFTQIYVNGVLERGTNVTFALDYGNFPLYFGTSGQPSWDHKLKGNLDEVSIYSRALSGTEIAAIYAAGSAGKCKPPVCVPPPSGLVVWWPGDNTTADSLGTDPGTVAGFGTFGYAPGKVGQAFVFDGIHRDRVDLGNPANLQLQDFTIETWAKRSDPADISLDDLNADGSESGEGGLIVSYGRNGYGFGMFNSGQLVLSRIDVDGVLSTNGISDTNWHHVAVTKSGSTANFYIDGSPASGPINYSTTYTFDTSISIGSRGDARGGSFYGMVDEPAVYNRALSASEIAAIYAAGTSGKCPSPPSVLAQPASQNAYVGSNVTFNVVAAGAPPLSYQWRSNSVNIAGATNSNFGLANVQTSWSAGYSVRISNPLGAITSSVATLTVTLPPPCDAAPSGLVSWRPADGTPNDSITGLNDTLVNGVSFTTGKKGQALSFDGVSAYATNTSPGLSNILNTYTIEFWAWPTAARATTSETTSGIQGISSQRYAIFPDHGSSNVGSGVSVGTNGVGVFEHGDVYLSSLLVYDTPITGWTHIAVVYLNQQPSLYVNGSLVRTGLVSTRISYPSTSLGEIGIGYGYYAGLLDEISIYNRALSPSEIQAIYHADVSGKCPVPPSIVAQPASQTNNVGGNATFNVLASGTLPLSYQWRSNSININGATNSSLPLTNLQLSYAANYSVRVTNVAGAVTSSVAALTVLAAPPCDPAPSGLVAWWPGDAAASDSAGGSSVSSSSFGLVLGEVGQGFTFNGSNQFITFGNTTSLQLSNFTIEAWIKRASSSVVSYGSFGNGVIFGYGQNGYGLYLDPSGFPALSKIGVGQTKPPIAITNTSFHHLAVTKSISTIVFYIDGIAYSAPPFNPPFAFVTAPGIGARSDNHDNCFLGAIDETSVYNHPLSAAEIQAIYNAGVSGKCPLPPSVLTQPSNIIINAGNAVSFNGTAAGSPPLSFQWYFNGSAYGAPTTNSPGPFALNFASVGASNAGTYQLIITNAYGSATSTVVTLTVTYPTTVWAWGYNAYGQCNVPAGLTDIVSIAAGGHHSLALRHNGTVVAWGWNGNGQCNVPVGLSNVVAIAGGTYFSAALKSDGTVVAWGDLYNGSLAQMPPGLNRATVLDSGGAENLVMKPDATLVAWGYGGDGRLNIPTAATNIIAIAAGHAAHNLALRNDRTIVGWGDPGYGALNIPPGLSNISQIDLGWGFSVVLKTDGSVAIWGSFNDYGPTYLPPSLPPLAVIAAGYEHVLGITPDATIVSWGHDRIGQTDVPAGLTHAVAVAGGLFHSLALLRQGPPEIFQQPSSETAIRDGSIEFVSGVVGEQLQYQWKFSGTNIPSGTLARLLLTNVQPAQVGLYSVAITNPSGFTISSNASLSLIPLLVASQPADQTIFEGDNATFTVGANGTGPFSYQWLFSGTPLLAQTNQSLILSNVDAAQAGSYSVILSNAYGSAQSSNATLTVNLPVITNQPVSQSVIGGQQVSFTVGVAGAALTYQWQFNGSPVSGETNAAITLTNVSPDNAGSWSVAINNSHRTIVSSNAILSVNPLIITQQPISASVLINSNVTFTAAAAGTAPMFFQWQKDGQNLADNARTVGSTSNVLAISLLQTNDSGAYTFIASNAYASVTSQVATLTVLFPPVILQNPITQTNLVGSNVTFTVSADGRQPLAYAWTRNGAFLADSTHIIGSSTPALTISNLLVGDSANYAAVVSNSDGAITSAVAVLTVVQPPIILIQPVSRLVVPGLPTTFTAAASGTFPLSVQWQLNGSDIPGATNASLTISNVVATNYGAYHLVVANLYGATNSADAILAQGNVASWPPGNNVPLAASNVVMLSAGNNGAGITGGNTNSHVLALRSDGTVIAWGNNSNGQTNVPPSATNVVAVAAGGTHSLALRANGTIVTWGSLSFGLQNLPPGLSNIIAIGAGTAHSLAVRADGKVFAWGLGVQGQTNVPANLVKAVAVSGGNAHSLAQRYDGTLAGFGLSTDDGQRGTPGPAGVPAFLGPVVGFSAGTSHSIAVRTNGTVSIWGSVVFGITNIPVAASNVLAVSASDGYTLALRPDGAVVGWGNPKAATNVPPAVSNAIAVAAGSSQAFALIGDGRPVVTSQPIGGTTFVGRDYTFRAIASGLAPLFYRWQSNGVDIADATNSTLSLFNLSLANAGTYQLIVSNSLGIAASIAVPLTVLDNPNLAFISQPPALQTNYQAGKLVLTAGILGNGPLTYQWKLNGTAIPAATNLDLVFDPVVVSNSGSYVLSVSNLANSITSVSSTQRVVLVKAWGFGSNEPPATLTNAIAIASGYGGEGGPFGPYLALRSDGKVVAWGNVIYGETNPPPSVTNFFITAIAAGLNDALALRSDGTVAAWGLGVFGQTNPPASATNVIGIACGDSHDLALRADGTVIAWGQGSNGQTNVPANATNIIAISGGGNHALALRANGTVAAWGLNSGGQTTVPASATNIIAVSAGYAHSLALRSDGTVLQWGSTQAPQPPIGLSNIVAIAAGYYHNTALRNDGTLVLWGFYYSGAAAIPGDMANVIQISTRGDRDLALFGTRAPACTVQPWDRFLIPGSNTTFVAKFAAPPPATYQWQYNGANIAGATTDTLILTNLQASQAGAYQLIASNTYGSAVTRAATLTLPNPPVITAQPVSQTNTVGATVQFNVIATGYAPLTYQWRQNGSNSVGLNSNILLLGPLTRTNNGLYSVLVSNPGGSTTSSNATLKVLVPQKFASGALLTNGSVIFFSGDSDGGLLTTNDLPGFTAQASSNLVDWVVLPNALSVTNGLLMLQDPDQPNYPARFYRILEQ